MLPTIPHTFLQRSDTNHPLCNTSGNPELARDTRRLVYKRCLPRKARGKASAEAGPSGGSDGHALQFVPFCATIRTLMHPQGDATAGQTKGEMIKGFCTRITFQIPRNIFPLENNCKLKRQSKADARVEMKQNAPMKCVKETELAADSCSHVIRYSKCH